jgi:hypothetical protein
VGAAEGLALGLLLLLHLGAGPVPGRFHRDLALGAGLRPSLLDGLLQALLALLFGGGDGAFELGLRLLFRVLQILPQRRLACVPLPELRLVGRAVVRQLAREQIEVALQLLRLPAEILRALRRLLLVFFGGFFTTLSIRELLLCLRDAIRKVRLAPLEDERAVPEAEQLLVAVGDLVAELEVLLVFPVELLAEVEELPRRATAFSRRRHRHVELALQAQDLRVARGARALRLLELVHPGAGAALRILQLPQPSRLALHLLPQSRHVGTL